MRLNKAKEILCDKEQRKKYDFWRRSGLAIPFDAWLKTDKFNRMSFHWAPKPKKEKMIESCHKESGICKCMEAAKLVYREFTIISPWLILIKKGLSHFSLEIFGFV